jgi:hypothetical protein
MTRSQKADVTRVIWRKSSHSGGGNQCVEVAKVGAAVAIRDSKNPGGGHLVIGAAEWQAFLDRAKQGRFDR